MTCEPALPGPIWVWLPLVFAVLLVAGLGALRAASLKGRRAAALWTTLRLASLLLGFLLLLDPSFTVVTRRGRPPRVAALLDTSRSMALEDEMNGLPRIDLARDLCFASLKGLADRLTGTVRLEFFRFDHHLESFGPGGADALRAEGSATRLGEALAACGTRDESDPFAALVLFTDGRENGSPLALHAATTLGTPIHVVGLGLPEGSPIPLEDARLAGIEAPPRVLVGEEVLITGVADLTVQGFPPPLRIRLSRDDRLLAEEALRIDQIPSGARSGGVVSPERQGIFRFSWIPETPGLHVISAEVTPLPGELCLANNRRETVVEVMAKGLEVLVAEAIPRWEYKFLRRALAVDPNVNVTGLIRTGEGEYLVQGRPPVDLRRGLPAEPESLAAFDCVILGDLSRTDLPPGVSDALRRYVEEQGGGLVLSPGGNALGPEGLVGTPLADALPFVPSGTAVRLTGASPLKLTPEGANHPVFRNLDAKIRAERWPVEDAFAPGPSRSGATTLAVIPDGDGASLPLVMVQRYGSGKTAAVLSDATWKWAMGRTGDALDQGLHRAFWGGIVRWVSGRENDPAPTGEAAVDVKPRIAGPDEDVIIRVSRPDLTPRGKVIDASENETVVEFKPVGGGHEARFRPVRGGFHDVRITTASGVPVGTARFYARRSDREFEHLTQHREMLVDLARRTGGSYSTPAEMPALADRLLDVKRSDEVRTIWRLAERPWIYLLLVALLALEWGSRRRSGLV